MFLTTDELRTHMHSEELEAITRSDETIAVASIDIAIDYVTSKLAKHYDTETIFAKTGDDRSPMILKVVKDIATWELIGLSNPSIDYEDKKYRYQQAVDWLNAVYKGMPANLPKLQLQDETIGTSVTRYDNHKRENYF